MTTTNDWIKSADRLPMGPFAQVWAFWKDGTVSLSKKPADESWQHWCEVMESALVAWQPCDIPAPPKEQTQRERDEAAYKAWLDGVTISAPYHVRSDWHAALAWERAEIAKLLAEYFTRLDTEHRSNTFFAVQRTDIAVLRARLLT